MRVAVAVAIAVGCRQVQVVCGVGEWACAWACQHTHLYNMATFRRLSDSTDCIIAPTELRLKAKAVPA